MVCNLCLMAHLFILPFYLYFLLLLVNLTKVIKIFTGCTAHRRQKPEPCDPAVTLPSIFWLRDQLWQGSEGCQPREIHHDSCTIIDCGSGRFSPRCRGQPHGYKSAVWVRIRSCSTIYNGSCRWQYCQG